MYEAAAAFIVTWRHCHIDQILEQLDQKHVMANGSTELGYLAKLRLDGWWNGQVQAY